jgi:hypothetical protein
MISAQLSGDTAAQDALKNMSANATVALARAIAKLGIDLQRNVQQNKLSGQALNAGSGLLRQGIGTRVDPRVGSVSTTVFADRRYAAAQEYGFTGTVNVRASLRRIKVAFGHPIAAITVSVKAHSRRMNLSEHSFLCSALNDMTPDIANRIDDVLREALR